jgi:ribonucleoside-diphosphate reductase alpha chain
MVNGELKLSSIAREILRERYLRRDDAGKLIESPEQMFARVARAIAEPGRLFGEDASFWEARFFERMSRLEFLPNSPTLMNAGLSSGQLAACFALPIEDDLDSIFSALSRMARIHQSGGGTGFSFSSLRPAEDRVRSTGGISSGPVSFMELFDHATGVIRRGGRRRGANMATLRVDHPDIEAFVEAKRTPGRLENFNLSIGVTNGFFDAVEGGLPLALRNPRTGQVVKTISAGKLFDKIVESAWQSGDPGLLFLDEINRRNPTPALGMIETTNPCGEQPLLPYESCTLGSINLAAFVNGAKPDWQRLKDAIRDGVIFLDNVIEANCYPFREIETATRRTRKIGLGVMGLAELLARTGVAYDSDLALDWATRIASFLHIESRAMSAELGERRGSFPAFRASVWPKCGAAALRNATITCIAPTGTISLIAGTSSGIEPFFALALRRRLLDGFAVEINPLVQSRLGLGAAAEIEAIKQSGSARGVPGLSEDVRRCFPTALEIAPEFHLRMQAAFQTHVDAAVSKTVNLSKDAPPRAVREIFLLAQKLHLKGVTVYRYGSRSGQPLSLLDDARSDCRECAV